MLICLFDIDGTLLKSGGAGKSAMEAAVQEAFGVPLADEPVSYSGRTDRAIGRDIFRLHGVELTEANWQRFIAVYLEMLPGHLESKGGSVCPGIEALLDELATWSDVAVGLLTGNLRAGAGVKLGHYGLNERFAFGGFGDDHWERDQVAAEALEAVRGHHGKAIEAERIWVIGDTPLDVRCARSIGARAVAVATGWDSLEVLAATGPDLLVADLSDATPLLTQLQMARLATREFA